MCRLDRTLCSMHMNDNQCHLADWATGIFMLRHLWQAYSTLYHRNTKQALHVEERGGILDSIAPIHNHAVYNRGDWWSWHMIEIEPSTGFSTCIHFWCPPSPHTPVRCGWLYITWLASFPGLETKRGLVHTVCACAKYSVTPSVILYCKPSSPRGYGVWVSPIIHMAYSLKLLRLEHNLFLSNLRKYNHLIYGASLDSILEKRT